MKPFDYEAAKNGAPVCTRDGRPARIICFDRRIIGRPIVALIEDTKDCELIYSYTLEGRYIDSNNIDNCDLMMAQIKHEGWVNVYRRDDRLTYFGGTCFKTQKNAKECGSDSPWYISTIHAEWEE